MMITIVRKVATMPRWTPSSTRAIASATSARMLTIAAAYTVFAYLERRIISPGVRASTAPASSW